MALTHRSPRSFSLRTHSLRALAGLFFIWVCVPNSGQAQVATAISRTTGAGDLRTMVNPVDNIYEITGGTRPGGGLNLFHSFLDFTVGTRLVEGVVVSDVALFLNQGSVDLAGNALAANLPTTSILARVTGVNPSQIFGTIDTATHYPGANLFLMNPNGIIFGSTAMLNVAGMAAFTTADYIRLADDVLFNAKPNAGADALLSSAPVTAFGFVPTTDPGSLLAGAPRGEIVVQGSTLLLPTRTGPAETGLSLVGGDISIGMDLDTGAPVFVSAPSGTINLASASSSGEFVYPSLQVGPNINGQSFTAKGTVSISDFAFLDVSGSPAEGNGAGGAVRIVGGQFVMDNLSTIQNTTVGNEPGANPGVSVVVDGDVRLDNLSSISVGTGSGMGRSGNLEVTSRNGKVELLGGSFFNTSSGGPAPTGDITITAEKSITVAGVDPFVGTEVSNITTSGRSSLEGGNITITLTGSTLSVEDDATIGTSSIDGRAGNIIATMDILNVLNGGRISSTSANGSSGTITITADDSATVSGQSAIGNFSSIANSSQTSPANIFITAGEFVLNDLARIDGDTAFLQGGTVRITGTESISLSGDSTVRSSTSAGSGTSLELSAPTIMIDQATLSTQIGGTDPTRVGGTIDLNATGGNLTVSNNSLIATSTTGEAKAGPTKLRSSDSIFFTTGARVETSSTGSGDAGQQTLFANNLLSLAGAGTGLFSEASGSGSGGAILAQANQVRFSEGAIASAKSTGAGKAGSVTIEGTASPAQSVVIDGAGSGIFTTTDGTGAGGSIKLVAQSIALQNSGTISASTSGSGDAGSITLTTTGNTVTLAGGSRISSSSSTGTMANAGDAGSVTINAGTSFQSSGSTVATSAAQGQGGNITITAGQEATLNNGTNITASSTGEGNAGNITINAGTQVLMTNSSVTTQASQAGGGDISIKAGDMVQMINSQINTSVAGGEGGGGNITIDPNFVILQNSQILANAFAGPGGNINITTGVFLADASSLVDASSQFGLSGTVTIQSPTSNLSAVWARLQQNYTEVAALLRARCAAQVSGQYSSFVQTGRDAIPLEPGGWLLSPISLSADAGRGARGEGARSVVASSVLASEGGILSIRGFDQNLSWPGVGKIPRRFVSILDSACGS